MGPSHMPTPSMPLASRYQRHGASFQWTTPKFLSAYGRGEIERKHCKKLHKDRSVSCNNLIDWRMTSICVSTKLVIMAGLVSDFDVALTPLIWAHQMWTCVWERLEAPYITTTTTSTHTHTQTHTHTHTLKFIH